jgi:hypothetical protein
MKSTARKFSDGRRALDRAWKLMYCRLLNLLYKLDVLSVQKIPVVINNFNRLSYPLQLISFLERNNFSNIIIIDNGSTFPPLLEFYQQTKCKVIKAKNLGHLALWKCDLYDKLKFNYFIYTDSDVVPVNDCPGDFAVHFKRILDEHPFIDKVGFGLKIDDLPDSFGLKSAVVSYEKKYWDKQLDDGLYLAAIDTTFAMYRPFSNLIAGHSFLLPAVRTGHPYLIRHMPWYENSNDLSAEQRFYIEHSNDSSTLAMQHRGEKTVY